jgi:hypothetical protein
MDTDDYIESEEFPGPYVRVRGRLARSGEVTWSPCLRTEKAPPEQRRSAPAPAGDRFAKLAAEALAVKQGRHTVAFLDYRGQVLESGTVTPDFFAQDQGRATFVIRLPYHPHTQAVVLRIGDKELGRLDVPTDRPFFTLLRPTEDTFIHPTGVLHLHWAGHDSEHPMTFFVRYSHNGADWLRPGVNLHSNDYYLDLREMPGGKRCVVEVIATNGYRTSYARTRHFEVPEKPPELFVGDNQGPVLFAQGFSREHGPITGDAIAWLAGGEVCQTGGMLDVRALPAGTQEISVRVTAPGGRESIAAIGSYDTESGARTGPPAGL